MRLGYVVIPAGAEEGADPCMQALANMVQEFGQFAAEAASNLSDGQVTDNELRRIEREGAEALAAINRLLGVAAALNREGKPAAQAALNEQKSDRARARR
jgi:aspartate/methionine/tyrosine aminotransferase